MDASSPVPPHPVVHVAAIRKTYGSTVAVDDISFDVHEGEIFGLIGPNGAGKTTTMECVEGLRKPDRGAISVLGLNPIRDVYALQNRIGVQLQEAQLQKRIKVREAVGLWASLYARPVDGTRLLEQLGLSDKRDAWFMTLSGGQKQRLFIALALINDPEVVFLDELTTGLDPAGAPGDLGSDPRHPRARQDGVPDHAPDGRGRATVRPRRHHRSRPHRRRRHAGRPGAAALPRAHRVRHGRRPVGGRTFRCHPGRRVGEPATAPASRCVGLATW